MTTKINIIYYYPSTHCTESDMYRNGHCTEMDQLYILAVYLNPLYPIRSPLLIIVWYFILCTFIYHCDLINYVMMIYRSRDHVPKKNVSRRLVPKGTCSLPNGPTPSGQLVVPKCLQNTYRSVDRSRGRSACQTARQNQTFSLTFYRDSHVTGIHVVTVASNLF